MISQMQAAVRSGLVRLEDVTFPLSWLVEKRLCNNKKLLVEYIAENSMVESNQFLESLEAWRNVALTRRVPVIERFAIVLEIRDSDER